MTITSASTTFPEGISSAGIYPTISFLDRDAIVQQGPAAVVGVAHGTTTLTYDSFGPSSCTQFPFFNATAGRVTSTTTCRLPQSGAGIYTWLVSSPAYVWQVFGTNSIPNPTGGPWKTGPFTLRNQCQQVNATVASCEYTGSNALSPILHSTTLASETLNSDSFNFTGRVLSEGWNWLTLYVTSGANMLAAADRAKVTQVGDVKQTATTEGAPRGSAGASSSSNAGVPARRLVGIPEAGVLALILAATLMLIPAVLL